MFVTLVKTWSEIWILILWDRVTGWVPGTMVVAVVGGSQTDTVAQQSLTVIRGGVNSHLLL